MSKIHRSLRLALPIAAAIAIAGGAYFKFKLDHKYDPPNMPGISPDSFYTSQLIGKTLVGRSQDFEGRIFFKHGGKMITRSTKIDGIRSGDWYIRNRQICYKVETAEKWTCLTIIPGSLENNMRGEKKVGEVIWEWEIVPGNILEK